MNFKKGLALFLCLAILLSSGAGAAFASVKISAKLISMDGDVQVIRAGGEKPFKAFVNMRLTEGDRIITGSNGTAKVQMEDDVIITLAENTRIYLSELRGSQGAQQSSINLQSGAVGSSVGKKLTDNSRFEIKTPTAVMGVRGTEFFTQYYNGNVDVRVVNGTVEVSVSVTSTGNIAGPGATAVQTYTFPVTSLQQVNFGEQTPLSQLQQLPPQPLGLIGMPQPFLNRIQEISQQNPGVIPQEIINTIDQAVESARISIQNRMDNPNIVPSELEAFIAGRIEGSLFPGLPNFGLPPMLIMPLPPPPPPPPPSFFPGGGGSTVDFGGDDGGIPVLDNATFDFLYEDGRNPTNIEYQSENGDDYIWLELSSEISGISYSVTSSNEQCATVQILNEGSLYAAKLMISGAGTTTITITGSAEGYQNFTRKIYLTVISDHIAVSELSVDPTSASLIASGATLTIKPTITPVNATNQNVIWSSTEEGVATVSNGVVTPIAAGFTYIEAKAEENFEITSGTEIEVKAGVTATPIEQGATNPSTVIGLIGDTFTGNADIIDNWTINTGNTGLDVDQITIDGDQGVAIEATIYFTGTRGTGTITIQPLGGALTSEIPGGDASF